MSPTDLLSVQHYEFIKNVTDGLKINISLLTSKLKKRVVIGTTGFTQKEEGLIKKYSKLSKFLKNTKDLGFTVKVRNNVITERECVLYL